MAADSFSTAPPMHPVDDLPPEPAQWPRVVGTISIIWASIGMLCGVCGVGMMALLPRFTAQAEQQFGPMPDVMKPTPVQMIIGVTGFIPPVILLVGGIMAVLRRPAARPIHLAYAVIGLILGVIGIGLGVKHQLDIMQWARDNPTSKWAPQASSPLAFLGLGFGAILSFAWPLFCIVWFGMIKRDTRDLTAGPEPAA